MLAQNPKAPRIPVAALRTVSPRRSSTARTLLVRGLTLGCVIYTLVDLALHLVRR